MTPDEVAEMLRVPRSWVIDAAYEDRIPAFKLGRYWRFDRNAIEEWLSATGNRAYVRGNGKTRTE